MIILVAAICEFHCFGAGDRVSFLSEPHCCRPSGLGKLMIEPSHPLILSRQVVRTWINNRSKLDKQLPTRHTSDISALFALCSYICLQSHLSIVIPVIRIAAGYYRSFRHRQGVFRSILAQDLPPFLFFHPGLSNSYKRTAGTCKRATTWAQKHLVHPSTDIIFPWSAADTGWIRAWN